MGRALIFLVMVLLLAGCMVGPDYSRPEVDMPANWRLEEPETFELSNTLWWQQFGDPALDELILIALQENKDLRIAAARVDEFLARYGATRAALYPEVNADAAAGRERRVPGVTDDLYQAQLSVFWELDVWGRIRRATDAARADILASEEGQRAVILTLVSAVASTHIDLLSFDRQLEIARNTATSREQSVELFELRFDGGVVSELELAQVKSEVEAALAEIPRLEKLIAQTENALSILLGRDPGSIPRGDTLTELSIPAIPAGLPSDLLEYRPDIRQAEQDLIAANARIGVARAAYFPTISLTGFLGLISAELGDLFEDDSRIWNLAVPATVPVFTAGRIRNEVQVAEAVQQQLLVAYQQVIQNAFREVEDALVDQNRTRLELAAQGRRMEALDDYASLARLRYDEGYASYLEVLDAERSLFNVELIYAQTRANLLKAYTNLYKAMGGGWVVMAEAIMPEAADHQADRNPQ